jgi:hypothetical protein
MRSFAAALLFVMVGEGLSQSPDRVITFDQLLAQKASKNISWTNPDSTREEMTIIQMSIPVDDEMRDLARRFMRDNYGRSSIWVEPRMIVVHSMDLGDLRNCLEKSSFLDRHMPATWETVIKAGTLPNGAQFIIDQDGTTYCLTPPSLPSSDSTVSYRRDDHRWLVRRHMDANPFALGIENVTASNRSFTDLTEAQIEANARLVRWLLWMEKGDITHLVSHHQFNDSVQFQSMLDAFSLELPRPIYRPLRRRDIGDALRDKIAEKVRSRGWVVKERF